jgi:ABC-2 type transport system permease protein
VADVTDALRSYWLIVVMWMRSTMTYRASFLMTTLGNFAGTALDFVAIVLMFTRVDSFGIADLLMGSMDRLGQRVRDGTLDTLLVRPAPVLAQVAADKFALRRLGRVTQGALVLGWAIARLDIAWTPVNLLLVPVMLISGAGIFGSVFVIGGAFQFLSNDASEVQNSFTYGGNTLLQFPPTVFAKDLVRGVTFVVPLAFVNWLPALRILGRDDPLGLPAWVDFAPPLVAGACLALSGLAWRAGLRSYRSTGS